MSKNKKNDLQFFVITVVVILTLLLILGQLPFIMVKNPLRTNVHPEAPEGMAFIPGGRFVVGSRLENEKPMKVVRVAPFFIDKLPVTAAEYLEFVETTGYKKDHPAFVESVRKQAQNENMPVVDVSYLDAQAYANWLNKRLPTESEWELAARGYGEWFFPWGETWDESRVEANSSGPVPVGGHPDGASLFEIQDMAGNVFHWTRTSYYNEESDNPQLRGDLKVVKAGSLTGFPEYNRGSFRTLLKDDARSPLVGFRCVKSVYARDANVLRDKLHSEKVEPKHFNLSEELYESISPHVNGEE